MGKDYYAVLGVPKNASDDVIKKVSSCMAMEGGEERGISRGAIAHLHFAVLPIVFCLGLPQACYQVACTFAPHA